MVRSEVYQCTLDVRCAILWNEINEPSNPSDVAAILDVGRSRKKVFRLKVGIRIMLPSLTKSQMRRRLLRPHHLPIEATTITTMTLLAWTNESSSSGARCRRRKLDGRFCRPICSRMRCRRQRLEGRLCPISFIDRHVSRTFSPPCNT
jgi:hypothetical protein